MNNNNVLEEVVSIMNNSELNSTVESITGVQYDREKNYYKELRAQQLAKRFDEINIEIQLLENEDNNIPFREFRLKVLKEEQNLLTQYAISDFKLKYSSAKMERELASLYDKIQTLEMMYKKQMERYSTAAKEKTKYISYKKSNKIRNKVIELNAKIGLIKSKQIMGSVNDFNSINRFFKLRATTNIIDGNIRNVAFNTKNKIKDTYVHISKSEVVSHLKGMAGKIKALPRAVETKNNENEVAIQM